MAYKIDLPACQSSISPKVFTTLAEELYRGRCRRAQQRGEVTETVYKAGSTLTGWPSKWKQCAGNTAKRGVIKHQSNKSLNRAAWMIANANAVWNVMITLTFRTSHPKPKACLRRFLRLVLGGRLDVMTHAWVMEFQARGVVHFHILTNELTLWAAGDGKTYRWAKVGSGRRVRTVMAGPLGDWIARQWIESVGDYSDPFLDFQGGGIVEWVDSHDLAAVYLGTYLGKLRQKMLPDDVAPLGRWWYMPPSCRPIPVSEHVLEEWVDGYPLKYVRRNPNLPKANDHP